MFTQVGSLQPSHEPWENSGSSGNAEGSSQLLLFSITYHRAHSSASGSEGLAQNRTVSLPVGTRQTLLLPSNLARLLIPIHFTNGILAPASLFHS